VDPARGTMVFLRPVGEGGFLDGLFAAEKRASRLNVRRMIFLPETSGKSVPQHEGCLTGFTRSPGGP